MSFLIIDSSSNHAILSLVTENGIVWSENFRDQKSSSYFGPAIARHFPNGMQSLDAILVGRGPGAFTGIRVGFAFAQGLARGAQLPLITICSLCGYLTKAEGVFASVIDARIGGVYALLQKREGNQIYALGQPVFVQQEQFKEFFSECVAVVGPDLSRLNFPCPKEEKAADLLHLYNVSKKNFNSSQQGLTYLRSF